MAQGGLHAMLRPLPKSLHMKGVLELSRAGLEGASRRLLG